MNRAQRLRLTTFVISLLVVLVAAVAKTSPDDVRALVPPEVREVISKATETTLEAQPGLWKVTKVVDGDTLEVTIGAQTERVRLIGIDTPETHDPRKPVQCFGEAAAAHTRQLVGDKNVRLEPDPTNSDRDKYGRLLRYVYLPDGTLVNAALVRDGYAFAYTVFPLTRLDEFRALEAEARNAGRGLWGGCDVDESGRVKQTTDAK